MKDLVFIDGNIDRANGVGKGEAIKKFYSRIDNKLRGVGLTHVSSKDFTKVPKASLYIAHSRGCGRMRRFGDDKATKICLDDYQGGSGSARSPEHYRITRRMQEVLDKIVDAKA